MTVSRNTVVGASYTFNAFLVGMSSDGWSDWTWTVLFTTPSNVGIPALTTQVDSSTWGSPNSFGVADVCTGTSPPGEYCSTGPDYRSVVRIAMQNTPGGRTIQDFVLGTYWHIPSVSSGWTFVPLGGMLPGTPGALPYGNTYLESSLVYNGEWELWATWSTTQNHNCSSCVQQNCAGTPCQYPTSAPYDPSNPYKTYAGNSIVYQVIYPDAVAGIRFGPTYTIVQQASSPVRCMPANYNVSRVTPFRVPGNPLLYTAVNDRQNYDNGGTWQSLYIVGTLFH